MAKYGNKKVMIDGIVFDSKAEARRYQELKVLLAKGEISNLTLQPRFLLQPAYKKNGKTIRKIEYIADFSYFDTENDNFIVEDVKGVKTAVYKLKKKLCEYIYKDVTIREVK